MSVKFTIYNYIMKYTSRKIIFIVDSERPLSSVRDPTLTQETLKRTSVKQPTW